MEIVHEDDGKKGQFKAVDGEISAGVMTYSWSSDTEMRIEHTVGNPEYKGIGTKLVNAAVRYARENQKKIVPVCPFVKQVFDRKKDLSDILA